ncbi:hypothetical protein [Bacillus sp. 1P06AnD]|uniref:hypothetical protein n=1 Tax=Bacillus sp. 1P06AnD TaxID=3132208 RepID=UPI0039A03D3D
MANKLILYYITVSAGFLLIMFSYLESIILFGFYHESVTTMQELKEALPLSIWNILQIQKIVGVLLFFMALLLIVQSRRKRGKNNLNMKD